MATTLPFDLTPENDAPDPSSDPRKDVEETMRLLRWAREHGWDIPELRVGGVVLRVRDLKPKYGKGGSGKSDESPVSIWDEFAPPGADKSEGA